MSVAPDRSQSQKRCLHFSVDLVLRYYDYPYNTHVTDIQAPSMDLNIVKKYLSPDVTLCNIIPLKPQGYNVQVWKPSTLKKVNFTSRCNLHLAATYKQDIYLQLCMISILNKWLKIYIDIIG